MGVKAEVNKDYTREERKDMRLQVFNFIFSQSTKIMTYVIYE